MKSFSMKNVIIFSSFLMICMLIGFGNPVESSEAVRVFLNGQEVVSDVPPIIVSGRTMVPLRAISEGIGMHVEWDEVNRHVIITEEAVPVFKPIQDETITIMGVAEASSEELRTLLNNNNPDAPDLVDLYLTIGKIYGIRGDIAFCQAAKETGWWRYGGLVQADQHNYCGMYATGAVATGSEDIHGADPTKVWLKAGQHGAFFDSPASGVEAHIQHLYAYATDKPLPEGRTLLDPRFTLVTRGFAVHWVDLGGKWAVPGYSRSKYGSFEQAYDACDTYGHSLLTKFFGQLVPSQQQEMSPEDRIRQLELENQELRDENARLQSSSGDAQKV
ncbi:MAG: stalk domain-containing protein [Bacillota bacterium]|nr:stalk domain-containing protein [Bacillota bacterium]